MDYGAFGGSAWDCRVRVSESVGELMRLTPQAIGNAIAWIGIITLIAASLWIVQVLGFPGILILGLLTTLICVRADLSEDVPTWGRAVFEARLVRAKSLEEQAVVQEAREGARSPLLYYRGCGLVLIALGLLGTVWQFWN